MSDADAARPWVGEVVVDASLAVKWVLEEDFTAEARMALLDWQTRRIRRVVPSWFGCEVANVLYKRMRKNTLTLMEAQTAVEGLLGDVVIRDHEPAVSARALAIALQLGRLASYDSHYVALAERLSCDLWTADERFWNASSAAFPFVKWLGTIALTPSSAT